MKKLIFAFVIAFSTITFAQTGKKIEAKPSKIEKTSTECYSTKENVPLTCVKVKEKEEKKDTSFKRVPALKPERKTVIKEDKK